MKHPFATSIRFARKGAQAAAIGCAALTALAPIAAAQVYRTEVQAPTMVTKVQGKVANPKTVRLLASLSQIQSDLKLGLLFMEGGPSATSVSHFSHPRAEVLPPIEEGLAAAGIQDLEPALLKLEGAGDKDAVLAAFMEVEAAVMHARSALKPSGKELTLSIVRLALDAAKEINPSGPTEVIAYQRAWSNLMVARSELDILVRNEDQVIAKRAGEQALAFDDLILSMPDPNQPAAVDFDPAPLQELIKKLQRINGLA